MILKLITRVAIDGLGPDAKSVEVPPPHREVVNYLDNLTSVQHPMPASMCGQALIFGDEGNPDDLTPDFQALVWRTKRPETLTGADAFDVIGYNVSAVYLMSDEGKTIDRLV